MIVDFKAIIWKVYNYTVTKKRPENFLRARVVCKRIGGKDACCKRLCGHTINTIYFYVLLENIQPACG